MSKESRIIALLLLVIIVTSAVALHIHRDVKGRSSRPGPEIVVVDLLGRKVRVPANVSRIVAVGPGALRIIVYLNATQYVVGVEQIEKQWNPVGRVYIMSYPELRNLPTISPGGPGKLPDAEMILSVHPQVIFATFLTKEQANELQEKTGIPVVDLGDPVLTNLKSLDKFYQALLLAGKVLHKEKRAEELIAYVESLIADLEKRTQGLQTNTSVYVGGIGYRGRRGITSTWCNYPLFEMLHIKSIVEKAGCHGSHIDVDREFLLKWNPDIIFIDENGLSLVIEDYVHDQLFYYSLKAFKEGNVYGILPFNYYATNYELALADAYFIGKVLFPQKFSDVNPVTMANDIMTHFGEKPLYSELAKYYGGFTKINISKLASR